MRRIHRAAAARKSGAPIRPLMVMVEDPVLRVAVSNLFRDHGYAVREVESLQDAVWRVELEPPEAIVVDVAQGWAAAHMAARTFRLLRVTSEVPLVAVSAAPAPEAESRAFDAVVTIPFAGRALLDVVRAQIQRQSRMGGAA